jgi:integrase/transposase-like protein
VARGFYSHLDGSQVRRYQCKSCNRLFLEEYLPRPINVSGKSCPSCGSDDIRAAGFHTLSDGKRVERYKCKLCRKSFQPDYLKPPALPAEENCPKCGSDKTVKVGKPTINKNYTSQRCLCKDCGKKFTFGKRKVQLVFLNGKVIHRYWNPPGLERIPDIACPNCNQEKAVLKTEYQDSYLQRKVRFLICLGCGQEFKGEGRVWNPAIKRLLGKTIPRRPWQFSDDMWDIREFFPNIEEYQFSVLFLNFSKCGATWFKNLVKSYIYWLIQTGIGFKSIDKHISRFGYLGRFLQQQDVMSMEEIDRKLLAIYWVEERGKLARSTLNAEMSTIKGFLNWGNAEQYFSSSPTLISDFDYPKIFKDEPDPLEDSVLDLIRDNLHILPEPIQLMFMLGFWLGSRPRELCNIRRDCISLDPDGSTWWIEFQREKVNDEHRLPLTTDLVRLIQQQQFYIKELHGEDYLYLFCHYQGAGKTGYPNYPRLKAIKRPPIPQAGLNPMVKMIRHLIEHCEIKNSNGRLANFTGAILRPSRATHLIHNGFSLDFVRIWLKHRHASTTKRHYTRYPPGELLDVAAVMANLGKKYYPYDSNPQSLRENPELHELDGLTMLNGEPLYGYCSFRDFCPRFGRCYTCGFHVASTDKLSHYKSQLEQLRTKEQVAFNYGSSEILDSYQELMNALEAIIAALESGNEREDKTASSAQLG